MIEGVERNFRVDGWDVKQESSILERLDLEHGAGGRGKAKGGKGGRVGGSELLCLEVASLLVGR